MDDNRKLSMWKPLSWRDRYDRWCVRNKCKYLPIQCTSYMLISGPENYPFPPLQLNGKYTGLYLVINTRWHWPPPPINVELPNPMSNQNVLITRYHGFKCKTYMVTAIKSTYNIDLNLEVLCRNIHKEMLNLNLLCHLQTALYVTETVWLFNICLYLYLPKICWHSEIFLTWSMTDLKELGNKLLPQPTLCE